MMRALLIDKAQKAKINEVVSFAHANLYYPGKSETIPGDDPRHVVFIPFGYRCVFSITVAPDGTHWRHLSISVPVKDKYVSPPAAFLIADLFGFSGYDAIGGSDAKPQDWFADLNEEDQCVVLAQELRKAVE